MTRLASVDTETPCAECELPVLARGLCSKHYQRRHRTKRALAGPCPGCGGSDPPYGNDTMCCTCRRVQGVTWRLRNPERAKEVSRRSASKAQRERRSRVLAAYGGACRCCGETESAFLVIDHVEGGGNAHRRAEKFGGSPGYYRWLEKNNYPPGFQALCQNCNFAKSHGGCPHGNC